MISKEIDIFGSSTTEDRSTTHNKFSPAGVWTHDLQIMTVHFMSLRRLLKIDIPIHVTLSNFMQSDWCNASAILIYLPCCNPNGIQSVTEFSEMCIKHFHPDLCGCKINSIAVDMAFNNIWSHEFLQIDCKDKYSPNP